MTSTFPLSSRGRTRVAVRLGLVAALFGLVAGCGGGGSTPDAPTAKLQADTPAAAGKVIYPATLRPGQAVPLPSHKTILTITGKISAANKGGALLLDEPTLGRFGLVQVRMYEPWNKKDLDFRGCLAAGPARGRRRPR